MDQKKWRSPIVWTSLAALIVAFLSDILALEFDIGMINGMVNGAITILIGFGILNNPNSKNSF